MATTIDDHFIDDIFGIPRDGSNISDDDNDDYSVGQEDPASFEEKAQSVINDIQKAVGPDAPEQSKPQLNDVEEKKLPVKESEHDNVKNDDVEAEMQQALPPAKDDPGNIFDATESKAAKEEAIDSAHVDAESKDPNVVADQTDVKVEQEATEKVQAVEAGTDAVKQPDSNSAPLMIAGRPTRHNWVLDAPAPKYQRFYDAKREALEGALLKGGELPFSQYFQELEEASVDVSVGETFQPELVCEKMAECQKNRERIKQIQLRVNRQYFQWERHMDLFEGVLSRIEYERGKQEGVKFEHMYDLESYFAEVKSLYKSIDSVMKTLDAAFECLSRQVTVTMPTRDIDRYSTGPKPMKPSLQGYDGLKKHANGGGSMPASRTRDEASASEPQQVGWGVVK